MIIIILQACGYIALGLFLSWVTVKVLGWDKKK